MKRVGLVLSLLLCAQIGCTVKAVTAADDPRPKNTCEDNSDCGGGICRQGVCQALNGKLETLFITATPASDSTLSHLTYVLQVFDVPTDGSSRDLVFPGTSHVVSSFAIAKGTDCYPTFPSDPDHPETAIIPAPDLKTLPANVTLSLSERLLGLPQQLFVTDTGSGPVKGTYSFDVLVPSGNFDAYFVPPAAQTGCTAPPQLFRNAAVQGASYTTPWNLTGVAPLTVHIHFPADLVSTQDLKGWVVDVVDPVGTNSISTPAVLGDPTPGNMTVDYVASLRYSAVAGTALGVADAKNLNDLIRLRPPKGVVAPTLMFERSGLSLFDAMKADIVNFVGYPSPVTVEGQLVRQDDLSPVQGDVYLRASQIDGLDDGLLASYRVMVTTDDTGVFHAQLPPGHYQVEAAPPLDTGSLQAGDTLAATQAEWDIPVSPSFQAGKVLQLTKGLSVTGTSRFQDAQVRAVATPTPGLAFDQIDATDRRSLGSYVARTANTLVDDAGHFSLSTDPGKFDITVRAPDSLGFAWFVRPGVQVSDSVDLGRVTLPQPAVFSGKAAAMDPRGQLVPLASASIQAYAYLDKDRAYTRDPKQAILLVEVAETYADADGAFRLLIPESIDSN